MPTASNRELHLDDANARWKTWLDGTSSTSPDQTQRAAHAAVVGIRDLGNGKNEPGQDLLTHVADKLDSTSQPAINDEMFAMFLNNLSKMSSATPPNSYRPTGDDIMDFAEHIESTKDKEELLAIVTDRNEVLDALRSSLEWINSDGAAKKIRIRADRNYDGPMISIIVDTGDDMDVWERMHDHFRTWWIERYGGTLIDYLHVSIW